ncbi:ankyrin repeat-containing domain protein [Hyaloscypha sp. PMI_1271]|nr:ankyrin repeat-containing domain protein [Hyaloscypha sp. PMI_1271]
MAALGGHEPVLKLLKEKGASIQARDSCGFTAIQNASQNGHGTIVRFLLDCGAGARAANNKGWSALHSAVSEGHEDIAKLLLEHGADANAEALDGMKVLHRAALSGHVNIFNLLIRYGADVNAQGGPYGNALHAAVLKGHAALATKCCEVYGADQNPTDSQGRTLLHFAAYSGSLNLFEYFLRLGFDVNSEDKGARKCIHYAVSGSSAAIIKRIMLLAPISTANYAGWSLLHWACRAGDSEILRLLLDSGLEGTIVETSEPPKRWTPLLIAMFHQNWKLLLEDDIPSRLYMPEDLDVLGAHSTKLLLHPDRDDPSVGALTNFWCNGCFHAIYGPRFHCRTCLDFDFCFMCKLDSEQIHIHNEWDKV